MFRWEGCACDNKNSYNNKQEDKLQLTGQTKQKQKKSICDAM